MMTVAQPISRLRGRGDHALASMSSVVGLSQRSTAVLEKARAHMPPPGYSRAADQLGASPNSLDALCGHGR